MGRLRSSPENYDALYLINNFQDIYKIFLAEEIIEQNMVKGLVRLDTNEVAWVGDMVGVGKSERHTTHYPVCEQNTPYFATMNIKIRLTNMRMLATKYQLNPI